MNPFSLEASKDLVASADDNKSGPDFFAFCTHEVAGLLSKDEDSLSFASYTPDLPGTDGEVETKGVDEHSCNGKEANECTSSGSLFGNGIGAGLSDFKKERLKTWLRLSVCTLTQEVDEIVDPVVAVSQIQSHLKYKNHKLNSSGSAFQGGGKKSPCKFKGSRSECEDCEGSSVSLSEKRSQCDSCTLKYEKENDFLSVEKQKGEPRLSSCGTEKENEVNDDLHFLLENDGSEVDEAMKKYSDELFSTLKHMEQHLEKLLDTVMSTCRPMTRSEKQQLRNLIQKLPPRNLDRVAEIVLHRKFSEAESCAEIYIDLEKEDNVTLWRLYYYIGAFEKAKRDIRCT